MRACLCCRTRKVRCDVSSRGQPCTNCDLDGKNCLVVERASKLYEIPGKPFWIATASFGLAYFRRRAEVNGRQGGVADSTITSTMVSSQRKAQMKKVQTWHLSLSSHQ